MEKKLIDMEVNKSGKITRLNGGRRFIKRLESRGIRQGKKIKVITKQPRGPFVVQASGCQMTIGRGIARKILVDVDFKEKKEDES